MIPKSDQKRVTRAALWGAGVLGGLGFVAGTIICLVYKIPIVPLFVTEIGGLIGGCIGALVALNSKETKPPLAPDNEVSEWRTIS